MNRHRALLVLAVLLVAPASAVQSNAIVARPARLLARPPAVAMAARKSPAGQARKQAASDEKKGLDATLPSLLYYGCYSLFFGKMLLVIFERISGA